MYLLRRYRATREAALVGQGKNTSEQIRGWVLSRFVVHLDSIRLYQRGLSCICTVGGAVWATIAIRLGFLETSGIRGHPSPSSHTSPPLLPMLAMVIGIKIFFSFSILLMMMDGCCAGATIFLVVGSTTRCRLAGFSGARCRLCSEPMMLVCDALFLR